MKALATSTLIPVVEPTQVGEARRHATKLADFAGLDAESASTTAILTTELANNLHKHAKEGMILLRAVNGTHAGVEILSLDKGPGMAEVQKCFKDGFSTSGTPGTGLGSVSRLAERWDVYSQLGIGTALVAQVGAKPSNGSAARLEVGAVSLPVKGEEVCGDNWAHTWNPSRERIMVADGLGHGPHAHEAAVEAETIFREKEGHTLPEVMQAIHNALKKTRGAAVAIAEMDFERRMVRYVGIGNIAGTIVDAGTTKSMVSLNGTVGHEMRKIQEFQYPWPDGAMVVMNSDGLLSRWDLKKFPGLGMRHPALAAGMIWRDFVRGRDDATVVVARERTKG